MIKLKNIRYEALTGCIKAEAYVEDCTEAVELTMEKDGRLENEVVLPKGYEYCRGHILHAELYLKRLFKDSGGNFLPHDNTIMWY